MTPSVPTDERVAAVERPEGPDPVATDDHPAPISAPSWRERHPLLARLALYGGAAALLAAGAVFGLSSLESARQQGLLTRVQGAEQVLVASPETALRMIDEEVLGKDPSADVRRRALLARAAALDSARRFDEAIAGYAALEASWPAGTPRGALFVPWANLLVRADRPKEALAMLARDGATDGWPADEVARVREVAEKAAAAGAARPAK